MTDDGIRLDLDQHIRIDQSCNLHHRRRRPDSPEHFAMGSANILPLIDVHQIHTRSDHIGKRRAGLLERGFNRLQRLNRLGMGIPLPDKTCRRHGR